MGGGDDVALVASDESHVRRQFYFAEQGDGAAGQQIGDVNVESQDGDEVGKAHSRVHRTEGDEGLAVTRVALRA